MKDVWQYLKRGAEKERIFHAYLFSGPKDSGKKETALRFIKMISCREGKNLSCQCPSCRMIENLSHPDFIFIKPDQEEDEIKIDSVRQMINSLSLKPSVSFYKTALIDKAHLMNEQAQNCILKTLEEPKGETVLILTTEHRDLLIPTVRSRLEEVKFFSQDKPESRAKEIKWENDLQKLSEADLDYRFSRAEALAKGDVQEVLKRWLKVIQSKIAREDSSLRQREIAKAVERAFYLASSTNVNKKLLLEALMLEL